MKLREYFDSEGAPAPKDFATSCGVSYTTIKAVRRGLRLTNYDVARKISEATQGQVTVKELCE